MPVWPQKSKSTEMKDNWQDSLRRGFDDYVESAPSGLWEGVHKSVVRRRRRRALAFASGCSAFAALVAAVLLVRPVASPDDAVALHRTGGALVSEVPAALSAAALPQPEAIYMAAPLAVHQSRPVPDAPQYSVETATEETPVEMPDVEEPASEEVLPGEILDRFESGPVQSGARSRRKAPVLGFSASGMGSVSRSEPGYGALYASDVVSLFAVHDRDGIYQTRSAAFSELLLANNSSVVSTSTRHRQPVRLELSASYEFAPRFFLSGGLSWSCLVSDMSSGTSASHYDTRQTLHYLGIPLALGTRFQLSDHLDLSLSAGGMLSKCVYGTSRTDYIVGERTRAHESGRISVNALQWSLNVAAGLGWRFSPSFGIFVKPGLAYYFDDGSFVETVYKERPLNFDLAVGLSFYL